MSECWASRSTILPLPSSPHWAPTITVAGIQLSLVALPVDTHVCGVGAGPVLGVADLEAGALEHRLEQPCERAVLVPHVLFQLRARPALGRVVGRAGEPRLDRAFGVGGLEGEHQVAEPKDAARPQKAG